METSSRISSIVTTCMLATLLLVSVGTAKAVSLPSFSLPSFASPKAKIACGAKKISEGVTDAVYDSLLKAWDLSRMNRLWRNHRKGATIGLVATTVVALYGAYKLGKRRGRKQGNC